MSATTSAGTIRTPYLAARRWLFFGAVVATTLAGTAMMVDIVRAAGVTALEIGIVALFVPTFAWISLAFWHALVGFALLASRSARSGIDGEAVQSAADGRAEPITTRTALVMPAHNEEPSRIVGGLAAVIDSLEATGQAGHFDVHLLSDTTDRELARAEEEAWWRMRARAPRPGRLHYRRRASNEGRKAGNIADFCETWGDAYDFMVVLDADSVMSGETLVALVRAMQANPRAGLIQTVPLPARQETLFGRFIQFGGALYGPMLAAGQAFWSGETSNYWGHNAILRMRPFVEHCRLPVLPGRPPLGGRVLSHDFVEAALMRRAGWHVYLVPALAGSHEEVPTNVLDFAKRDRRWAQGSLQHLRLLGEPGLKGLSRLHFALGAMGYLASVLWLLILLASTAYVLLPTLSARPLLGGGGGGDVVWPLAGVSSLMPLLAFTALVLFLPKALGLLLGLAQRRRDFGGAAALTGSAVAEALLSVLVAPVMMMLHTVFVLGIVAGRDVEWGAQARAGRDIGWPEALRRTAWLTVTGLVWGGGTLLTSPMFFAWLSPIFAGLLLAAPIVRWSSRADFGRLLRRNGMFLVPSETRPRPELALPDLEAVGAPMGALAGTPAIDSSGSAMMTSGTHETERALFDLRRGRAVFVTPPEGSSQPAVLCAPVESLDPAGLDALRRLGSGPIRLVVTPRRANAMGVSLDTNGSPLLAISVGLNGETAREVLELSSATSGFDASGLDAGPATEPESAGLALARFGRLLPAVLTVPADPARVPELGRAIESRATLSVSTLEIRALVETRPPEIVVTPVSDAPVPLEEAERARFMLFREADGLLEHVAVLIGDREAWPDPVPVRLHSACLTGDLFGSLKCDCGEQLRGSLKAFVEAGGGVLLYLQQEGRGIGLGNKLRAYALQESGLDTVDADRALGFGADERRYDAAVAMLHHLGIERVRILTNNPEKVRALEEGGVRVVAREALHGTLNRHNLPYVRAKVQRAGHWLGDMLHGIVPGA